MVTLLQKHKKMVYKFLIILCKKMYSFELVIGKKKPSITLWHRDVLEHVSLDYLNCASLSEDVRFIYHKYLYHKYGRFLSTIILFFYSLAW